MKKIDIKKILNFKISASSFKVKGSYDFFPKCAACWSSHYRLIFAILFGGILLFTGYIWHQKIFHYQWDEARKQEYILLRAREMKFKESEFQEVTAEIERRKAATGESRDVLKEIFKPEEKSVPGE